MSERRRYRRWVVAGTAAAVVGVVVGVAWAGVTFVRLDEDVDALTRADLGSTTTVEVDEAASWTIHVEPADRSLTGVRFSVLDADGEPVDLRDYGTEFTYSTPDHSGRAVATVRLEPGTYTIVADGSGPGAISAGPSVAPRLRELLVGVLGLAVPLVVGGVVLAVLGAVRLSRLGRPEAPPAAAVPAGEWPGPEA